MTASYLCDQVIETKGGLGFGEGHPSVTLRHGRSHQHPAAGRIVAWTGAGANAAITFSRTGAPNSLNLIAPN
jgi:hypothetical protein